MMIAMKIFSLVKFRSIKKMNDIYVIGIVVVVV